MTMKQSDLPPWDEEEYDPKKFQALVTLMPAQNLRWKVLELVGYLQVCRSEESQSALRYFQRELKQVLASTNAPRAS